MVARSLALSTAIAIVTDGWLVGWPLSCDNNNTSKREAIFLCVDFDSVVSCTEEFVDYAVRSFERKMSS